MPSKASDADAVVGAWNRDLVIDRVKMKTLNKPGLDITLDQLRQLYALLYPLIQADFKHRDDLYNYIEELKKELEKQRTDTNQQLSTLHSWLSSHIHTGNLGAPTSPPVSPDTLITISKLSDIKTEDTNFIKEGSTHVETVVLPSHEYLIRNTNKNKKVKISGSAKFIEDLLSKDAKIFVPFDVGEEDSALKSEQDTLNQRTITDL